MSDRAPPVFYAKGSSLCCGLIMQIIFCIMFHNATESRLSNEYMCIGKGDESAVTIVSWPYIIEEGEQDWFANFLYGC